jgi:alpha-tubulin suppressor-like RCC1 family protein
MGPARLALVALTFTSLLACTKNEGTAATPKPIGVDAHVAGRRATQVAVGWNHSCALGDDGRVACWGASDHGQVGTSTTGSCDLEDILHGMMPPTKVPCRDKPGTVDTLSGVAEISAGGDTTCARLRDGTVKCWGDNHWGIVGDGTLIDRGVAATSVGVAHAAQISMSSTHACARLDDGTVTC